MTALLRATPLTVRDASVAPLALTTATETRALEAPGRASLTLRWSLRLRPCFAALAVIDCEPGWLVGAGSATSPQSKTTRAL